MGAPPRRRQAGPRRGGAEPGGKAITLLPVLLWLLERTQPAGAAAPVKAA